MKDLSDRENDIVVTGSLPYVVRISSEEEDGDEDSEDEERIDTRLQHATPVDNYDDNPEAVVTSIVNEKFNKGQIYDAEHKQGDIAGSKVKESSKPKRGNSMTGN